MKLKIKKDMAVHAGNGVSPSPGAREPQMNNTGFTDRHRKTSQEDTVGTRSITADILVQGLNEDGILSGPGDYLKILMACTSFPQHNRSHPIFLAWDYFRRDSGH
ncbi:MAG: hypothetical protein M0Q92_01900 [Methanoregula sp.]|jgi:hypothetical protein|nr:hypothetical protein [Methanoregula sp.]